MEKQHFSVELPVEMHRLLALYAAKNGLRSKGDALKIMLMESPTLREFAEGEGIEVDLKVNSWGGKRKGKGGQGE